MINSKRRLFPRALAECIAPVIKPALGASGELQARLLRDWPLVVGAELAARTVPESLAFPKNATLEGTLTLQVPGAMALEVQHLEPVILERLAVYFGYRAIARIRLRQCASAAPAPKKRIAAAPPAIEGVEDEDVRNALSRLARALQSPGA